MTEKLSNQTIRHILEDIRGSIQAIKDGHGKELGEIKIQVSATNGRVKALELWRSYVAGAMGVIILLLVPIVLKFIPDIIRAFF